jgi:hypothetical protein
MRPLRRYQYQHDIDWPGAGGLEAIPIRGSNLEQKLPAHPKRPVEAAFRRYRVARHVLLTRPSV